MVAIPACDEAARIADCLGALASDPCDRPLRVVLFANNCTDDTEGVALAAAALLGLDLRVIGARLDRDRSHAGEARRLAMAAALAECAPHDLLLTTDADGLVTPGWRAGNHAAIAAGADIVCGRAVIDPVEARAIPCQLHEDDRRETAYGARLDRLAWLVDPDPADPWPRHREESGASIAVRPDVFRAAGGVPAVRIGEDRALVERLRRRDAAIRHDPSLTVVVSGRLDGRAAGGMADTMRRRIVRQDETVDDRFEPVSEALRRIRCRRRFRILRAAGTGARGEGRRFGVPDAVLARALDCAFLGEGWAIVEEAGAALASRTPITHRALAAHDRRAARLAAWLDTRPSRGEAAPAARDGDVRACADASGLGVPRGQATESRSSR